MPKRFLKIFNGEFAGLHQAAILLALSGIAADILGLLRDRFLASTFGAGKSLDIYYAAFRVPDFLYTLLLFLTASTAFIPLFLEKFSKSEAEAREFFGKVLTFFGFGVVALLAVAFFLVPKMAYFVAPGFSKAEEKEFILLTRILLLSPFFLGLSNIFSGVIQSFRLFFVYALSPLLYNAGIIAGVLVFYPIWGFQGVVWGVILGAFLHFIIQAPSLFKLGLSPIFKFFSGFESVVKLIKLSLPRTLGLSLNQLVLFFITAVASTLGAGSIAIFNLAMNLQSIPLSIVGLSYSVAAFPTLARSYLNNDRSGFLGNVSSALRHIIFWSLPATFLFIVLRAQLVRVILGAGAFGWVDTRLTTASLALLSLSVLSQSVVMLFVRAFYAAGKTRAPLFFNIIASALTVLLSLVFLNLFDNSGGFRSFFKMVLRVEDIESVKMLMLPFAFSLGSIFNASVLFFWFKRDFGEVDNSLRKSFFQILAAGLFMGFAAYGGLQLFSTLFNLKTFFGIFLQGFFSALLGIVFGVYLLRLFKNRELEEIFSTLKRKFWKTGVLASEPEKLP